MKDGRIAILVVAAALGELRKEVMFLGGATVGLLVTNAAAPPPRLTDDVDLVGDLVGYAAYVRLAERLRELGFVEDSSEGAPICRWLIHGIKVDVMSSGAFPGYTNRWYGEAIAHAQVFEIAPQVSVRVMSAPFFIADKLDTFADGRRGDYMSSHDLEDLVAVVDGRDSIEADVRAAPASVREFLAARLGALLADPDFVDAVAGHLPGDSASQARLPLVLVRMRAIAASR